jgi:outer membrane protein with beta-barrel domain
MDCATLFFGLVILSLAVPVLEIPMEFAGPGNGEYGFDVIAIGRDTAINQSTAYGLRVRGGYHFNERFQIEGLAGGAIDNESLCAATILVAGSFTFRPRHKVEPYVLLGAGQATREIETPAGDTDDSGLAAHAMVGSRFFFTQTHVVALRVEAGLEVEDTFDTTSTHPTLALGITWRMGGP